MLSDRHPRGFLTMNWGACVPSRWGPMASLSILSVPSGDPGPHGPLLQGQGDQGGQGGHALGPCSLAVPSREHPPAERPWPLPGLPRQPFGHQDKVTPVTKCPLRKGPAPGSATSQTPS